MTAKPVPEHISDERLAELRSYARLKEDACLRDEALLTAKQFSDFGRALTELQHRREAEAPFRALVVECRNQINSIIEDGAATDWRMWRDDLDKALAASPSSPASVVRVKATEADVERVARALAADELGMGDPPAVVESIVNHQWRAFESQARVALSALGEHP